MVSVDDRSFRRRSGRQCGLGGGSQRRGSLLGPILWDARRERLLLLWMSGENGLDADLFVLDISMGNEAIEGKEIRS